MPYLGHESVVVIGMGEMGSSFARGFLRAGYPVVPVLRGTSPGDVAATLPEPRVVLVAVAEVDLETVLRDLPPPWRGRSALLQNELLPRDWQGHVESPTVIVVWFEKKPGRPVQVILPSPIFGPATSHLAAALDALDIPWRALESPEELEHELVFKNAYVLTTNTAGLIAGGTVGELWKDHAGLADEVATEILDLQEALIGRAIDRERILSGIMAAVAADPEHGATGRTAPDRLRRSLAHADARGLAVPRLRRIREEALPDLRE